MSPETSKIGANENPMKMVKIAKIVINIGVGKSGEIIERATKVLTDITGHNPNLRMAKQTVKEFGIHKGEPIGVAMTLRGSDASDVLKRLIIAKTNNINRSSFDETGNCSFGIREHIEIPNIRYDPSIGIFGMNVSVVLERKGYRVMRRKRTRSRVGNKQKVSREDAIQYFTNTLGVEVIGNGKD